MSDYNEWFNMIINYYNDKENTSQINNYQNSSNNTLNNNNNNNNNNSTTNNNNNNILINDIISPEDEYIFLLATGIDTNVWLPTAKRKLKCKKSKLKLDNKNRLILCEMESKTNGIKCIKFKINDILSINVGSTNDIIINEIEDCNKHLCMIINNKPELNITFLSTRERTLFEKVLCRIWLSI